MKKKLVLMLGLVLVLTGCSISDKTKDKVIESLQSKNIVEPITKVGEGNAKIQDESIPFTIFKGESDYYAIKIDNPTKDEKDCKYVVSITNEVRVLENQKIDQYDKKTKTTKSVTGTVYKVDGSNIVKFCTTKDGNSFSFSEIKAK